MHTLRLRGLTAVIAACAMTTGYAQASTPPSVQDAARACGRASAVESDRVVRTVGPGRWVTLEQVAASLPKEPIAVGFDIDDTLIFPSPGFRAVLQNTEGPGGSNPYGKDMRAVVANPRTWEDLHQRLDQYALPKDVGRQLIDLHQKRGDRIYLITARPDVAGAALDARMRQMFRVELAGPVVFTAFKAKTDAIRDRRIAVYYGDSDSDIEYAQAAGARGVRVLRAANAIDYDKRPCFGKFGEEVIVDSDR